MSQRITAITIVDPFSKMLNVVRRKVRNAVWFWSCTEVINTRHMAPTKHAMKCTGDRTTNKSEQRPIKILPRIPPMEPSDVMFPA